MEVIGFLELMQSFLLSVVVEFNLLLRELQSAKVLHCYEACTLLCTYLHSNKRCVHLIS